MLKCIVMDSFGIDNDTVKIKYNGAYFIRYIAGFQKLTCLYFSAAVSLSTLSTRSQVKALSLSVRPKWP